MSSRTCGTTNVMMSTSPVRAYNSTAQLKGWVEGVVKTEGRRQNDNVDALKEQVEGLELLSGGGKENESRLNRIEEVSRSSMRIRRYGIKCTSSSSMYSFQTITFDAPYLRTLAAAAASLSPGPPRAENAVCGGGGGGGSDGHAVVGGGGYL